MLILSVGEYMFDNRQVRRPPARPGPLTHAVCSLSGHPGRPLVLCSQSLSLEAAPSTARTVGRLMTDDPGQDPGYVAAPCLVLLALRI